MLCNVNSNIAVALYAAGEVAVAVEVAAVCFLPLQWLALPPEVAPIACSVLPLSNNPEFTPYLDELCKPHCACTAYIPSSSHPLHCCGLTCDSVYHCYIVQNIAPYVHYFLPEDIIIAPYYTLQRIVLMCTTLYVLYVPQCTPSNAAIKTVIEGPVYCVRYLSTHL